ncbi:MAG TPA: hypothetical protein VJU87_04545 [Gemmatimonadaceae bacterium]|nr:hypothetical protein [Gemmatimonadaceae bacterium]
MATHRRMSDVEVATTGAEQPADAKANGRTATTEAEHDGVPVIRGVRATDIEPYTGLRYLSKLFRFMAVILLLLLVAEIATGLYAQGATSIPTLLGEASRLIVLAGVLWGAGDLAHLLIDVGHDVRASRVLLARQTFHFTGGQTRDVSLPLSAERAAVHGETETPDAPPIP